jgi:predicted GNAT family acetyltransferase
VRAEADRRGDICGVRLYVDRENLVAQQVYRDLGMSQSRYYMFEIEFD